VEKDEVVRGITFNASIPQFRLKETDRQVIDAARQIRGESLSEFVRQAAVDRAELILRSTGADIERVRTKMSHAKAP